MNKNLKWIVLTACLVGAVVGCFNLVSQKNTELLPHEQQVSDQIEPLRIAALKGPTAMGMANVISAQTEQDNSPFSFSIANAPEAVVAQIVKGEVDAAAIPSNLASVLYNKIKGNIKVLAINTLCSLQLEGVQEPMHDVSELKGKTIVLAGKGATPDIILTYLLKSAGLDPEQDVKLEWKSEHAEVVAYLKQHPEALALVPQPFATVLETKVSGAHPVLDINSAFSKASKTDASIVMGVFVVRADVYESKRASVDAFMQEYKQSIAICTNDVTGSAQAIAKLDIVPLPIAQKALPQSQIVMQTGEAMKKNLSGYLEILFQQNPKVVGGKLPDDAFYAL